MTTKVIDIREAKQRLEQIRADRSGKGARCSVVLRDDWQIEITCYGPNGTVVARYAGDRTVSEPFVDNLAHNLSRLRQAEHFAKFPPPPPKPEPKWRTCRLQPNGYRSPRGCRRRAGHTGEHVDRKGVTYALVQCIHPPPYCTVYTEEKKPLLQCNACGALVPGKVRTPPDKASL